MGEMGKGWGEVDGGGVGMKLELSFFWPGVDRWALDKRLYVSFFNY